MPDDIKRDVGGHLRLSFIPIGGYRRENECQFCGRKMQAGMIRMTYETEGVCVELDACGQCLEDVGVRDILPKSEET
jgi:hypothetical protein